MSEALAEFFEEVEFVTPSHTLIDVNFFDAMGLPDLSDLLNRTIDDIPDESRITKSMGMELSVEEYTRVFPDEFFGLSPNVHDIYVIIADAIRTHGKNPYDSLKSHFFSFPELRQFGLSLANAGGLNEKIAAAMASEDPSERDPVRADMTYLVTSVTTGINVPYRLFDGFGTRVKLQGIRVYETLNPHAGISDELLDRWSDSDTVEEKLTFLGVGPELRAHMLDHDQPGRDDADFSQEELLQMIEEAESDHIPTLINGGYLAYGLNFDLDAFFTDKYRGEALAILARDYTYPEPPPTDNINMKVEFLFLIDEIRRKIRRDKTAYLKTKKQAVENGAYLDLAVTTYGYTFFGLRHLEDVDSLHYSVMRHIHSQEFNDHAESGQFKEYVQRIKRGTILSQRLPAAVKRIEGLTDDENAQASYFDIFNQPSNRTEERAMMLTRTDFLDLWGTAFNMGWGDILYEELPNLDQIINKPSSRSTLAQQESGALALLLRNTSFRNQFRATPKNLDYELLEHLIEVDEELFGRAYDGAINGDNEFIMSLIRLRTAREYGSQVITITPDSKKVIIKSQEFSADSLEATLYVLENYETVNQAIAQQVTGAYTSPIHEIDDIEAFVHWYYSNRTELEAELQIANIADRYVAPTHSTAVRQRVRQVYKKLESSDVDEDSFSRSRLRVLQDLDSLSSIRVLDTIDSLLADPDDSDSSSLRENPHTVFRHKDIRDTVKHMAQTASFDDWDEFSRDVVELGRTGNFARFRSKYSSGQISRAEQTALRDADLATITRAYTSVGTHDIYSSIPDRLALLRRNKGIDSRLLFQLTRKLEAEEYGLVEFITSQVENGMPIPEARAILEFYPNNEFFVEMPPAEMFKTYERSDQAQQQVAALPSDLQQEFDYSPFNQYVTGIGHNPDTIRNIIESGFKLHGAGRFIGDSYTRSQYIFNTAHGRAENKDDVERNFKDVVNFLLRERVLIHHSKKGRRWEGGCLSVNPHVSQIEAEPLREYLRHTLSSYTLAA
tara:strand:- start:72197 stop:75229 length:3033 start_codon:yes stop_codon:yes gene_type:complete